MGGGGVIEHACTLFEICKQLLIERHEVKCWYIAREDELIVSQNELGKEEESKY